MSTTINVLYNIAKTINLQITSHDTQYIHKNNEEKSEIKVKTLQIIQGSYTGKEGETNAMGQKTRCSSCFGLCTSSSDRHFDNVHSII